ncbi:MAG TPA: penicillin acylase family protein [Chitinophagaceae bacterium]|nr:penicillin acylase family protein [Chitinophagaceae bacterium]
MKWLIILIFIPCIAGSQTPTPSEINRYKNEARRVTIIRDNWGIPHVYGKTDADAVFGLLYAQCEENFRKVEENNLEMLGRLSEKNGKNNLYDDLQMKIIYDSSAAIADYKNTPASFKKLLDAAADGVNYFLYTHPEVKPAVLKHFEPWFSLMRTNGSISATQNGGLTLQDMKALYKIEDIPVANYENRLQRNEEYEIGSNGFAIGPSRTNSKNAILYINPHVTFYFRSEMQMVSDEGLNAYGAVTWGTFFIFQGFNEHCGWMHTSSDADVADLYKEKIEKRNGSLFYLYDGKWLPVKTRNITLNYKTEGSSKSENFTVFATGHGPLMGIRNGDWLSLKENNRSLTALMQSWLRTKATGFEDFKKVMDMRSNSSDNTVFADDKGNIAYWHGNFIPIRDPKLDWALPVDGTTSATEWKGIHTLNDMVHVYNPSTGWIQNCNSTPFTVSGSSSPSKENYPSYMAPDAENFRAINAERLLNGAFDITVDKLIKEVGYSHYLSAFDVLLPPLFTAYDNLDGSDSLKQILSEPISLLKGWDKNSSVSSTETTLAIEWGSRRPGKLSSSQKLNLLYATMKDLEERLGSWKIPWGDINRYQRIGENEKFEDNKPGLPSGLASYEFGSLPSFVTKRFPGTNKRYGFSGNSFIACVEFGKKITAKSIITGGQSFDPSSKHFMDQAQMYLDGNFKQVLFYKEDVIKHSEKTYHPGE